MKLPQGLSFNVNKRNGKQPIPFVLLTLWLTLWIYLVFPANLKASILYKEYFICSIDDARYLCASHIVQNNEDISKILVQRGYLFKDNLSKLRLTNPGIADFKSLAPGDILILPIKKIIGNEFRENKSGKVLIPFITDKPVEQLIKENSSFYNVKKGDSLSKIITKRFHTRLNAPEYQKALRLFKYLNPGIKNINRLSRGQAIRLPHSSISNQDWYSSIFPYTKNNKIKTPLKKKKKPVIKKKNIEEHVALTFETKAVSKGKLFIPYKNSNGFQTISLNKYPIIKPENFQKIIFIREKNINEKTIENLKNFYGDPLFFKHEKVLKNTDKKRIFKHNNLEFQLPFAYKIQNFKNNSDETEIYVKNNNYTAPNRFLSFFTKFNIILPSNEKIDSHLDFMELKTKDNKEFLRNLFKLFSWKYTENTSISFPYKGLQVEASTNIVTTGNDKTFIVDFSQFYGDTIQELEKIHFTTVQVKEEISKLNLLKNIFNAAELKIILNPVFTSKEKGNHIKVKIPGLLVYSHKDKKQIFFTNSDPSKFDQPVLYYLNWLKIKTIFI